jgi:hypothetical protein
MEYSTLPNFDIVFAGEQHNLAHPSQSEVVATLLFEITFLVRAGKAGHSRFLTAN